MEEGAIHKKQFYFFEKPPPSPPLPFLPEREKGEGGGKRAIFPHDKSTLPPEPSQALLVGGKLATTYPPRLAA